LKDMRREYILREYVLAHFSILCGSWPADNVFSI